MRFATCQMGRNPYAALVSGGTVYHLGQAYFRAFRRPFAFRDLLEFLQSGALERLGELDLAALRKDTKVAAPARSVVFRAPIPRPPKIVCVGLNYRAHAEEQKVPPPEQPLLFAKAPNAVIGPDEAIELPSDSVDPEVELGVVIGKPAWHVKAADAWSHVFGFTIFNDVTERAVQKADRQWFRGKSFRTFAPMGPVVVTPDEVDAGSLDISLRVNGEVRQSGNTSDLIFGIPAILEYASACFELETGDVIATGTPAGVGVFRNPPVFLKEGDLVEAAIQGIGTLANPVRRRAP